MSHRVKGLLQGVLIGIVGISACIIAWALYCHADSISVISKFRDIPQHGKSLYIQLLGGIASITIMSISAAYSWYVLGKMRDNLKNK